MPRVTLEVNPTSRLRALFQIRADREQEVSLGREASMLPSLERAARLW